MRKPTYHIWAFAFGLAVFFGTMIYGILHALR